jgi:pyruvate/2-oxoglutarate/acetoin dehydrogenase E1 component
MALSTQLMALNQEVMENRYELSKDITTDGAATRALLIAQYEATLNRQLGDANAEIIALRSRSALDAATNGITVTNTNNINQMQQQAQQQAQYANLAHLIYGLGQNITNGAINVGSGTLTANPTNTNTAIR